MLTIAIPTYNRNQTLNKNLRLLLPQVQQYHESCQLLFLDNCSPTPIADTVPEVFADFPQITYQITRNKVNIGANANIMRCFEMCETEWIWCLSDDDPIMPDALTTISQHLETYADCVYFNFSFDNHRPQTYVTTGIEDFVDKLDTSANLPWISSSVHRTANIQTFIKYGYQFAYSMLPHVAALLVSLGAQGRCCMSAQRTMADNMEPTPFENNWSVVSFALGSPVIYDIPLPFASRQALMRKLLVTHYGESIKLETVVIQLLLAYIHGNRTERRDNGNLLFQYDQIVYRNYYLDPSFKRHLLIAYYRLMMRFPRITARILHLMENDLITIVRRPDRVDRLAKFFNLPRLHSQARQDRYERI